MYICLYPDIYLGLKALLEGCIYNPFSFSQVFSLLVSLRMPFVNLPATEWVNDVTCLALRIRLLGKSGKFNRFGTWQGGIYDMSSGLAGVLFRWFWVCLVYVTYDSLHVLFASCHHGKMARCGFFGSPWRPVRSQSMGKWRALLSMPSTSLGLVSSQPPTPR